MIAREVQGRFPDAQEERCDWVEVNSVPMNCASTVQVILHTRSLHKRRRYNSDKAVGDVQINAPAKRKTDLEGYAYTGCMRRKRLRSRKHVIDAIFRRPPNVGFYEKYIVS